MTLRVLVVDDEALARSRLLTLLADCTAPALRVVGQAAQAQQALELLQQVVADVVLLDIHMPGLDGLRLAQALRALPQAPAVVFVTAHDAHAVQAFELDAADYLTKPVRLARLQQALQKVQRLTQSRSQFQGHDKTEPGAQQPDEVLLIQERGHTERVALSQVLYVKAELKYLTVRTLARSFVMDGSLHELQAQYPGRFVRIHRNALVARSAMRALHKYDHRADGEGWALRLHGVPEPLTVSRRQLAAVRQAMNPT